VALKFLPEATASDDRALARFYNEVRIARQVTHPNVCRVYDVGVAEGLHYISMEFVDGEDLGSLLNFSVWYAGMALMPFVMIALLAVYGFRVSLGGRRLLKQEL